MNTLDLDTLKLARGCHASLADGACIMECVAYVAGEPWSDHPECVSPILATFLRNLNDAMDDEERQALKPFIALCLHTNTGAADEQTRGLMAADWLVRTYTPAWLDLAGLNEYGTALRIAPEVTSWDGLVPITPTLIRAREKAAAARDAAGAAAWAASWAAAGDAAGAAAVAKLRPTVTSLQASAVDLARRMALVGKTDTDATTKGGRQ